MKFSVIELTNAPLYRTKFLLEHTKILLEILAFCIKTVFQYVSVSWIQSVYWISCILDTI